MNKRILLVILVIFLLSFFVPVQGKTLNVATKGKNWKARVKTFLSYDNNVTQSPVNNLDLPAAFRGRSNDDGAFNYDAYFAYTHKFNKKFKIEGSYELDGSAYFELTQYNLLTQMFGVKPVYNITPLMNLTFQYIYFYNVNDGNNFSGVNFLSPSFNHFSKKFGVTRIFMKFKTTNNFVNNGRDSETFGGGFRHIYLFSDYQNNIGFGYEYASQDTAGNFDRDIHTASITSKLSLPFDIVMDSAYQFSNRDYDTFLATTGTATRDDYFHTVRTSFKKQLIGKCGFIQKITGQVKYAYHFNDSTTEFREYQNHRVDVGLDIRF